MEYDKSFWGKFDEYERMFGEKPPLLMMPHPEKDILDAIQSGVKFQHPDLTQENMDKGLKIA